MSSSAPNPKAEIRKPKEGRNPKPEVEVAPGDLFWNWGEDNSYLTSMLHEDSRVACTTPRALQERTALFGEKIIEFAKKVPLNPINTRLVSQLVGAGTSVGANYCEADDAVSGKEFKLKIGTCRKESKEGMFFLRMVAKAEPSLAGEARTIWREAKELNLIFGAIWRK
jgi:four helix bundle protein